MSLDTLMERQYNVQTALNHPMGAGQDAIKENMLALIVEATEVLEEINWKPWHKQLKIVDRDKLKGELADIMLFWMNAVTDAGISAEEISNEVTQKQFNAIKRFCE